MKSENQLSYQIRLIHLKLINSILDSFSDQFQRHRQLKLLRIGILVFLIFNAIQLLLFYEVSLGYLKLTSELPSSGFLDGIAYSISRGGPLLLLPVFTGMLGMVVSIFSLWKRIGSLITYLSCLVLFNFIRMVFSVLDHLWTQDIPMYPP